MHLTEQELLIYENQGFLLLPECFSRAEVEIMKAELSTLSVETSPQKILEKDGKTVRSFHGSHTKNNVFNCLTRHPLLVYPAMQIVGSKVYIYQFKVNMKAAFSGDIWKWHQDYIYWYKEDGMPKPKVVNAMCLLDDMNEFNGPLFVIPSSHKEEMIDVTTYKNKVETTNSNSPSDSNEWISSFSANLKYSLSQELVTNLVSKYGITFIKAAAGSVLFFDSNIVHASSNNISPFGRSAVIITYNSIENTPLPVQNPRPDFLVSQDYRPVTPLAPDELSQFYSVKICTSNP
ncbi:phytanoyl-CoA dioxygenase family protein [Nostoc sp. 'Peltigera membranacea cyanobiont' 232]|uniref:phytanoyl-CoA dioxygenase family protein n=1 Tax=Nostoc sp. 'Peltigera membranacea cyanobiont' 232 TaxID=2014531 RepID=UPI000B9588EC|nr:phytanoyl-CoA dioxygenase family protein [Nostoc sp. 'Peltigera membranacea cyanobiont' 232]OYE00154.1 phytanoyl-CoA dioxygenase [Nostoc sp. 'Peltigera membranacea cyanobiont' 232]